MKFETSYPIGKLAAAQFIVDTLNKNASAIEYVCEFRGIDLAYVKIYAPTYDLLIAGLRDVHALTGSRK